MNQRQRARAPTAAAALRHAEATLRANEAWHRTLLDAMDEGICVLERLSLRPDGLRDYRYLTMNSAMQAMFGVPDLTGRSMREASPREAEAWSDDFDRVLETGEPVRLARESEPAGRALEMVVTRLEDTSGPRLLAVIRDVTERARAQAALRQSEQRLQKMMSIDGLGVLTFREDGTLIGANDAFLEMQGYSREEVESGSLTWRDLTADEYVAESERQVEMLLQTGRMGPYEKESTHKDGTRSWMLFAGAALGDGTIVEYCIDIDERRRTETALRASEERYRGLFQAMDEGYALCELVRDEHGEAVDCTLLEVNPAFERTFGLEPGRVIGRRQDDVFSPEPAMLRRFAAVVASGKPARWEYRSPALGRWYDIQASPRGGDRFSVLFDDIEPRKALELARSAQLDRERTARAAAEAFLAVMSHELKTPVTSIYGNAALIARNPARPDAADLAFDIQEESRRLVRIVDDLLVLSGVERGLIRLAPEPVLMRQVLDEVIADIRHRFPGASFQVSLAAGVPPVLADPTALRQVLHNVVSNAAKYAGAAGVIEARAAALDDRVLIEVLDRGPGPGADPDALFGLFYRAPHNEKTASGTGIGLYVARQLMTAMGGTVDAALRDGGGAMFRLTLPAAVEDGPET